MRARTWFGSPVGRWLLVGVVGPVGLGAFVACGSKGSSGFNQDSGTGPEDSGGGGSPESGGPMKDTGVPVFHNDSGKGSDGPNDAPGDANAECPAASQLIYVTGSDNHLWSFDPQAILYPDAGVGPAFVDIGAFNCLNGPTHMTIDRQANAWVVANSKIFKASTKDATCVAVSTWTPMPVLFGDFALTFVGVSSAIDNNLYLLGSTELKLFDVATGTLTNVGPAPDGNAFGDMTSNGDGTLYFLQDSPTLTLYNMNPNTGATIGSQVIPGAHGGGSQALAFWGGSFWAFENNVINQFNPKTVTTTQHGNAPLQITGAGQSTCVPRVPPPPPPPPK